MSADIVKRLRLDAEPTESDMEEAATEIERLRARVAVMETALTRYAEDEYNGYNATGAYARAALEAKP
jgi:hypothetical protein